jgi:hypothetical protein
LTELGVEMVDDGYDDEDYSSEEDGLYHPPLPSSMLVFDHTNRGNWKSNESCP